LILFFFVLRFYLFFFCSCVFYVIFFNVLFFLCSLSFFAALIEATRRDRAFDFTGDGEGDRDDSIDGQDDKDELNYVVLYLLDYTRLPNIGFIFVRID
jgi:hypothetical protein